MFKLDPNKIAKQFESIVKKNMPARMTEMRSRMDKVSDILYKTATAKRPMMNAVGSGVAPVAVKGSKKKLAAMGARRISNPDAKFGVPVRTGNLQRAIMRKTEQDDNKILVRIYVDEELAPYAKQMEYGNSSTAARPFMRTAMDQNSELIKKIITQK